MPYTVSITSKGQMTLPKALREKLDLKAPGKAQVALNKKGEIVVSRPKTLTEVRAMIAKPTGKDPLTEYEKLIGSYLAEKYDVR